MLRLLLLILMVCVACSGSASTDDGGEWCQITEPDGGTRTIGCP